MIAMMLIRFTPISLSMSDSQIILGLDPGFGRLGFGFITASGGRLTALDYGIISTPADWTFAARLKQLGVDLEQLLSEHPPAVVGLEKLFFPKTPKLPCRLRKRAA